MESVTTVENVTESEIVDEVTDIPKEPEQSGDVVDLENKFKSEDGEINIIDSQNIMGDDAEKGELPDKDKSEKLLDEQEQEQIDGELVQENIIEEKKTTVEVVEEEEQYVEEPPPDPSAPYNLSDSKEALKEPFELRYDQVAEIEQLWDFYQDYTPVYTDIDQYITEKELVYMLKALLLMTYTPEQLQELIDYCVRPPHPQGHITYEQFLMMVKIRQRDFPVEEELRSALQVLDPEHSGSVDRETLKELLSSKGTKLTQKQLDNLIKEVDMSNDGTIGVEDVVGTMCIDLNKEDIQMLRDTVYPKKEEEVTTDDQF